MTQQQREEMAAAIRDNMPPIPEIEDMIAFDIRTLEPLIDRWLKEAREGRFPAAAADLKRQDVPTG